MARIAVYGIVTFPNTQRRNNGVTVVQTEAANRGATAFDTTDPSIGGHPAGVVSRTHDGRPALSFSYLVERPTYAEAQTVADEADAALNAWMTGNATDFTSGTYLLEE